jgi:hypothetical protein
MEYHHYQTMLDEFVKEDKSRRKLHLMKLFEQEMENLKLYSFREETTRTKRILRLSCEYGWQTEGRPYYNIHPQMVRALMKTNLDSIPAKMIEIPDFRGLCFRFAEPVPTRVVDNTGFHAVADETLTDLPICARSVLFSKFSSEESDSFIVSIDEGFRVEGKGCTRMLANVYVLEVKNEETIPEALSRLIGDSESTQSLMMRLQREQLENLFRVIIATGFLANTPEDNLVTQDILSKDLPKYTAAIRDNDVNAIKVIEDRARRRKGLGWNVGTSEMVLGEVGRLSGSRGGTGDGNELSYSHLRGGHPHVVRYGPGKTKAKIKWFRPTRVRPDLPFKDE